MSCQLGEFLERFYGVNETFRTVQGRIRHRKRESPPNATSGRRLLIGRPRAYAGRGEEVETNLAFWAHPPNKVRLESTRVKEGVAASRIDVVNGDDSWTRHENGVVERGMERRARTRGADLPPDFARHFNRCLLRQCFAALTLEALGACQVANRECLRIRAVQVPGTQLWPHWLAWEATEFELAADVERATLLSIVGVVDGHTVESHEVLEVVYDQPVDDSRFINAPSPDESVQPATAIAERMTLEAAAARAPFVVLQPMFVPGAERSGVDVMYHCARPDMPDEYSTIGYHGADAFTHLWLHQRAQPDERHRESLEWEAIEADGRRFMISDPSPAEGLRILAFEHLATHVEIISDLPPDALLELALSMQAVIKI